jgi:hypothetical protein
MRHQGGWIYVLNANDIFHFNWQAHKRSWNECSTNLVVGLALAAIVDSRSESYDTLALRKMDCCNIGSQRQCLQQWFVNAW